MNTKSNNKKSILPPVIMLITVLYLAIAWSAFQYRNPTANEMSFLRDFLSVITFKELPEYQTK